MTLPHTMFTLIIGNAVKTALNVTQDKAAYGSPLTSSCKQVMTIYGLKLTWPVVHCSAL